jgi:uncharacterized cupredoxin-like copper-binding protein
MRLLLTLPVLALLGACSTATPTHIEGVDRTITIHMRDNHFEPDRIEVRRGESVGFRFVNQGKARHDAFVGDAEAQRDHEREARMADDAAHGDGHAASEKDAITVEPGDTGELTHQFSGRGETIIGCHEPGHYSGGMVVTVTVE